MPAAEVAELLLGPPGTEVEVIYVCTYVCMYVCACVSMYACMCVCMYITGIILLFSLRGIEVRMYMCMYVCQKKAYIHTKVCVRIMGQERFIEDIWVHLVHTHTHTYIHTYVRSVKEEWDKKDL